MIAWFTPGMREEPPREEPPRPALHDTRPKGEPPNFGPLLPRIKAFIAGHRKSAISIVGLFVVFGLAWWFRYEPMGQQGAWEQVWDRWYGRVCVTPLPAISNVHGIACSQAEISTLTDRIVAEVAAREARERPAREAAQRVQDEARARQQAEWDREKKANMAAQEKNQKLNELVGYYLRQQPGHAPEKWEINQFRADGHSEEYIAQQVMPWRNKLLAAGAPKAVVDEYFGGDPFLKPGEKP
jgi:hypothetical protein